MYLYLRIILIALHNSAVWKNEKVTALEITEIYTHFFKQKFRENNAFANKITQ